MMYEAERNRGLESLRSLGRAALNRFAGGKMSGCDYVAISRKIDKAIESLKARPYMFPSKYVLMGVLPNGERTSEDEAEALKMLADYYARQTA